MSEQSESGTDREKIERARELLKEAHDDLGHPDNSLLGPAIDQIDAHERRHWSVDAGSGQERDENE
jgi:hypothetical protein